MSTSNVATKPGKNTSFCVLIFGGSATYGMWDTKGGWLDRLKHDAHKQTIKSGGINEIQVINLGVSGNTTTKILERMPSEIYARYSQNWEFVFVISGSSNDQKSIEGKVAVPIEKFTANIKKIARVAKQHSHRILFLGIPALGKPTLMLNGKEFSNERIRIYEKRMKAIIDAEGLPFVPLYELFKNSARKRLHAYDYLHPNDKGHYLIYKTAKPAFQKLLS